jgi:hypothetical protein
VGARTAPRRLSKLQSQTRLGMRVSAFANCGPAVAHVPGSYGPLNETARAVRGTGAGDPAKRIAQRGVLS